MQPSPNGAGFHPHFSTWLASSEQLERTLVGHHDVLRDFLSRLRGVEEGGPANHFLLIGPRGIGKTHLLCLGGHYVTGRAQRPKDWAGPSAAWVGVLFAEEEYAGQNSLANFLLTLFAKLQESLPLEELWHLPRTLHQEVDQHVIACCFERLERFHRERGGWILLLIDNLQKVLQQWPDDDHQRLRSFLSRNHLLVIFGSAPSVFREVMDQKAAFHDFFEVRLLSELTPEQVLELLARRFQEDGRQAEYETRKAELARKIPALAVLTGGNPRLVLFLYDIATRSTFLDIEVALRNLLEELREYFVRRFDELPDQARKVLDTIAQMPGPATPTEIAQAARLQPALVNAQLKRLKEGHYVQPVKFQRQKTTCYDITERLFRIWRQTATVAGRQRFRFLADFLKLYFTPDEVRGLYSRHLDCLRQPSQLPRDEILRHIEELYYFQAAGPADIRYGAFSIRVESLKKLGEMRRAEEETQHFAVESLRLEDKPGVASAYQQQAILHTEEGRYAEAAGDVGKLVDAGAYEDATVVGERLLATHPNSSDAWRHLGEARMHLGNHAAALEAFRNAAGVGPPTVSLWFDQARALWALERGEEAVKCAEQGVAMEEKNTHGWEYLGMLLNAMESYERALRAFQKAAEVGQPTSSLWSCQALSLCGLGRQGEALERAKQAVAMEEKNPWAWEVLGIVEMLGPREKDSAKDERALKAFSRAAELGQPTSNVRRGQAVVLHRLERGQEALQCAKQAVETDRNNAGAWETLGTILVKTGDYEHALEALSKVAEVGQPTAQLWQIQALLLMARGRLQEALRCAEQAVAMDPTDAATWEELGIIVGELGDYERALVAFQTAAKLGRASSGLWLFQAISLRALERPEEALKCAEQAVAMDEKNAEAWAELGTIISDLGNHDRALAAFHTAANVGAGASRFRGLEARALRQLGRGEEGLAVLTQALACDEGNCDLWLDKAWTLFDLNQVEEAFHCVERARKAGAPARRYHHDRGDMLLLQGRYAEALKDLDEGLKTEPNDWDLQTDRLITLGCLGQQGQWMEALPTALAQVQIPPASHQDACEYVVDLSLNALRRGESGVAHGLVNAALQMEVWTSSDWFGRQLGDFLRHVLDSVPQRFLELIQLVRDRLKEERARALLEPFLKAGEFLQTKDVTLLERLFPEVRELVLDIVKRVDPASYDQFKRLI